MTLSSASSVKRRRKDLGLSGSGATTRSMPRQDAEHLVIAQMDRDPAKRHGVRTIRQGLAFHKGVHLTRYCTHPQIKFSCNVELRNALCRDFISDVMHAHDPAGFDQREPTAKKIHRIPKVPVGIHERWAGDGHDKLYKIGFPIWAVVDDATSKYLDGWVVPNNRLGTVIGYLFLCLVEKYGGQFMLCFPHLFCNPDLFSGVPLQFSTDCGSETTVLHGLATALRYPLCIFRDLFFL